MCVAGHEHVLVAFRLGDEFVEEAFHQGGNLPDLVADEEFEIHQHLVVAAAPGVDFLAYVAKLACEQHFHLRMHVLHTLLNHKLALFSLAVDGFQLLEEELQLVGREQVDGLQHGDVRH